MLRIDCRTERQSCLMATSQAQGRCCVRVTLLRTCAYAGCKHQCAPTCLQAHRFCPRCGAPTAAVQHGSRRQCTADSAHRAYPRTDPVVIMLVESVDGRRALLGRSKRIPSVMRTCLSGFVDQCESIEEVRLFHFRAGNREYWLTAHTACYVPGDTSVRLILI